MTLAKAPVFAKDGRGPGPVRPGWAWWSALIFALVFPTAISWIEMLVAPPTNGGQVLGAIIYGAGKAVQLALPLACLGLFGRRRSAPEPRPKSYGLAIGFGTIVAGGILGLYYGVLRDTILFAHASASIHGRLAAFDLDSPAGFALFAFLLAVGHSFLEEYYWRWFVFGWLEQAVKLRWAIALSSIAFMVPHADALAVFLGTDLVPVIVGLTLCVGVGGAFWAWLYHRSDSLLVPWLSHFLVDAGLLVVGYDMFFARSG